MATYSPQSHADFDPEKGSLMIGRATFNCYIIEEDHFKGTSAGPDRSCRVLLTLISNFDVGIAEMK